MTNTIFDVQNVSYSYAPGKSVLQNINLTVTQGEQIVLFGANGSGKTTLQKILAGLLFADQGMVNAFGRPITETTMRDKAFSAAFRRRVGIVFQNSDVQLFCSTVEEEILFGLRMMGVSEQECKMRTQQMLDFINIRHLAGEAPHYLSGGEKKKVALAAILVLNPEVILLDEPTNGLDPKSCRWLENLLQELTERGKTILFSTHYLERMPLMAPRAWLFGDEHTILADGATADILNNKKLLLQANLIDEE